MITPSEEYRNELWRLQYGCSSVNYNLQIPAGEPIYKFDLLTRKLEAPNMLGVTEDHQSERIFFEVDRDCNGIDLAQTVCVIVFKNAKKETFLYLVPEYHIDEENNKLIFSWLLQGPLTKYAGNVQFMVKFFKINQTSKQIEFELNSLVAQSKVLEAWENTLTDNSIEYQVLIDTNLKNFFVGLQTMIDEGRFNVYWVNL